jgi:hypothetical protein
MSRGSKELCLQVCSCVDVLYHSKIQLDTKKIWLANMIF